MAVLSLQQVQLAYGHVALLDHVDFSLEPGERVGLIGRNGTGKSSLLALAAGRRVPDDGRIVRQSGLKTAFVEQEPEFSGAETVGVAVAQGLAEGAEALIAYEEALAAAATGESGALEMLDRAQAALESSGGWLLESRLKTALERFGLAPNDALATLSGGQRKRVALARAFVAEPDLILLDEPTNHLDIDTIAWLETLLVESAAALLFITHDRAFLDRVATRIVELDRGVLRSYPGNFAAYEVKKAEQLAVEEVENAKFDKLLAQEEVWIRKGIEARRTRNEGRVRRLETLRRERAVRREVEGTVRLAVDAGERSGKLVAELAHVTKAYGGKVVVRDLSVTILRGEKVGVIGPNGVGKTTLLNLILGRLAPDSGRVRTGTNIEVAYFDQMRSQLDPERSVVDTISPGSEWIEQGGSRKHVMSYLGDFLFDPARARSPVKSLSGGERNRLLLARLFARPANVLVLDEPTNDLDIATLELLEELLIDYTGTVFLVSHDRVFLDHVVTETLAPEGDGVWRESVGGYSDWLRQREARSAGAPAAASGGSAPSDGGALGEGRGVPTRAKPRVKLSYKEQRELEALPERITELEREQAELTARLSDPDFYKTGGKDAARLQERNAALEAELMACLERWEELEARKDDT